MLTTLRQSSQRTTIHSVPSEVLLMIFEEVALLGGASSLYACSRVHSSWQHESLAALYRHLEIATEEQAVALGKTEALNRYRVTSLRIGGASFMEWSPPVDRVLDRCLYLVEVTLASTLSGVPGAVFDHRAFKGVKSLRLFCSFECTKLEDDNATHGSSFIGIGRVKPTSLAGLANSVTRLSLSSYHVSHIGDLLPLAAKLESLHLPPLTSCTFGESNNSTSPLAGFLDLATSLSHLKTTTDEWSVPAFTGSNLSRLLKAVRGNLKSVIVSFSVESVTPEVFEALREASGKRGVLSSLKTMEFSEANLNDLEGIEGWKKLSSALKEKQILVATRKG